MFLGPTGERRTVGETGRRTSPRLPPSRPAGPPPAVAGRRSADGPSDRATATPPILTDNRQARFKPTTFVTDSRAPRTQASRSCLHYWSLSPPTTLGEREASWAPLERPVSPFDGPLPPGGHTCQVPRPPGGTAINDTALAIIGGTTLVNGRFVSQTPPTRQSVGVRRDATRRQPPGALGPRQPPPQAPGAEPAPKGGQAGRLSTSVFKGTEQCYDTPAAVALSLRLSS